VFKFAISLGFTSGHDVFAAYLKRKHSGSFNSAFATKLVLRLTLPLTDEKLPGI
jgi:hypothetical protein